MLNKTTRTIIVFSVAGVLVVSVIGLGLYFMGYFNRQRESEDIDKVIQDIDKSNINEKDFEDINVNELGFEEDEKVLDISLTETDRLINDLNIDRDFENFNDITY